MEASGFEAPNSQRQRLHAPLSRASAPLRRAVNAPARVEVIHDQVGDRWWCGKTGSKLGYQKKMRNSSYPGLTASSKIFEP